MTWYFNFCAPTIPNDLAINFHRGFQTTELMILLILFTLYHTYYRMCGPDPLSETNQQRQNNQNQSKNSSEQNKSDQLDSEVKSQNQDKSVSIAEKIKDIGSQNESYISFKSSGNKFLKKKTYEKEANKEKNGLKIKENVSTKQIEQYFPIVFGHHAIAMAASIMYSPYAQQSVASILYVLFSFLLAMVNSKRMRKLTFAVWIFMAFLNVFIMMSALLEVGQSNWDFVNNVCFAEQYVSLY